MAAGSPAHPASPFTPPRSRLEAAEYARRDRQGGDWFSHSPLLSNRPPEPAPRSQCHHAHATPSRRRQGAPGVQGASSSNEWFRHEHEGEVDLNRAFDEEDLMEELDSEEQDSVRENLNPTLNHAIVGQINVGAAMSASWQNDVATLRKTAEASQTTAEVARKTAEVARKTAKASQNSEQASQTTQVHPESPTKSKTAQVHQKAAADACVKTPPACHHHSCGGEWFSDHHATAPPVGLCPPAGGCRHRARDGELNPALRTLQESECWFDHDVNRVWTSPRRGVRAESADIAHRARGQEMRKIFGLD